MEALERIIELARMAKWFAANRPRLRIGRQEDAEALFNAILDRLHVDALGEALKSWLVESEAIDGGTTELSGTNSEAGGYS